MEVLARYVSRVGRKAAARQFGVSTAMVSHWLCGRKRITGERAVQIERATGGAVPRRELRPDLFGEKT
ncbi:MAG: YdaS family helix-turn-helix protein [Sinobacteraceae bacterium]|nr:YdaS family helix-turn-helix protein [Nevskiaceae bacterium]